MKHLHNMGRFALVILFSFLVSEQGRLQAQLPLFEQTHGTANDDFGLWTNYDDGQMGYFQPGLTDGKASVTFLDISGNPIWTKTYADSGAFIDQVKAPNGDLVLVGERYLPNNRRSILVTRISPSGQLVWARTYDLTGRNRAMRIVQSVGDSYIIKEWNSPNNSTDDQLFIMRIDGNGTPLWSKRIDSGDFQVNGLAPDGQGGCFFGGSVAINGTVFLGRFDVNGNLLWINSYPGFNGYAILTLDLSSNGNRVLIGGQIFEQNPTSIDGYAAVADLSGNILWANRIPSPTINPQGPFTQIEEGSDNKIYVSQRIRQGTSDFPSIVRMDFNGNVEKNVYFNQGVSSYIFSLAGTLPERIIASRSVSTPTNGYDNYLVVLDSSLENCYSQGGMPAPIPFAMNPQAWNLTAFNLVPTVSSITTMDSAEFQKTNLCITCPYEIEDDSLTCSQVSGCNNGNPKVCIPLTARYLVASGIVGMDFTLNYDPNFMQPTGVIHLGSVVTSSSTAANAYVNVLTNPGQVNASVYYTSAAPANAEFQGTGEIACVEFSLLSGYSSGMTLPVSASDIIQSYQVGYDTACAEPGSFTLLDDSVLNGRITYWNDTARPLRNDPANPGLFNPTEITPGDITCMPSGPAANPVLDGSFAVNTSPFGGIEIARDIAGGSSSPCPVAVQSTINSMDCYWTGLVTTQNNSWVPNAYQMVAMDVNMDGSVTASDITHIQNRIVQNICEYPQAWNQGSSQAGKDWRFVDEAEVAGNPVYTVSANYPSPDNQGYSRLNVPNPGFCLPVPFNSNPFCTSIDSMNYHAILLGDVNGTWSDMLPVAGDLRNSGTDRIELDLNAATSLQNCEWELPLKIESGSPVQGLDWSLQLPSGVVVSQVALLNNSNLQLAWNQTNDNRLLVTAFSLSAGGVSQGNLEIKLVLESTNELYSSDLAVEFGLLNGQMVNSILEGQLDCTLATQMESETNSTDLIKVYPNPFTETIWVDARALSKYPTEAVLMDVHGAEVSSFNLSSKGYSKLSVENLPVGIYFLRVGKTAFKLIKP